MLTKVQSQIYTLDKYRALEETADFRNEYHDGIIVPMSGGTINHNRIVCDLIFLLKIALKGTPYEIFSGDLRVWIPQYRRGTYPDVMLVSGKPVFNDNRKDEILNPSLIVEVLSKSTEEYDRGTNFLYYRSIPELKEYLLVSQYEYFVEHYQKTGEGQWLLQEYRENDQEIALKSVDLSLAIKDIYQMVDFSLEE